METATTISEFRKNVAAPVQFEENVCHAQVCVYAIQCFQTLTVLTWLVRIPLAIMGVYVYSMVCVSAATERLNRIVKLISSAPMIAAIGVSACLVEYAVVMTPSMVSIAQLK